MIKESKVTQVIKEYLSGTPTPEITEKYKVSRPTLYSWLQKAGIEPNRLDTNERVEWDRVKKNIEKSN